MTREIKLPPLPEVCDSWMLGMIKVMQAYATTAVMADRAERKPMTDMEIDATMYECGLCMTGKDISRAVEAFHNIKE